MPSSRISYGATNRYQFEIWAIDPPFSPLAYEFSVADWSIDYVGVDRVEPGVVVSTCTLVMQFDNAAMRDLMTADYYFLKVLDGINKVWAGFITPDLGSLEVVNGNRFITIVANDGFQMLSKSADPYQFVTVYPLATQIAESLNFFDFWELYDGFAVGGVPDQHWVVDAIKGSFYWTGSLQNGLWYEDDGTLKTWRTFRQAIDDICTTFSLKLFQDKGILVFRSIYTKTPDHYSYYTILGGFIGNVTHSSGVTGLNPHADGIEMYKPAIRNYFVKLNQTPFDQIRVETAYRVRSNYYVAEVTATGANKLRFNSTLRVQASVPDGYDDTVEYKFDVYLQLGSYWDNGTSWADTSSFVSHTVSRHIINVSGSEQLETFNHTVANYDTAILPNVGSQPLYITLVATQTAGADIPTYTTTCPIDFEYNAGAPGAIEFMADNGVQRNGVDVSKQTELGDVLQSSPINSATAGELRAFLNSSRNTHKGNLEWDAAGNSIQTVGIVETAKSQYRPGQYYEISLDQSLTYNHLLSWGSDEYTPVNLTLTEKDSTVTYRQWVYGSLASDPKSGKPSQDLTP